MKIESLQLRDFRNYRQLDVTLHDQVNIFIGKNGQGKSNILEAIELSISGESFRPVQAGDWIRHESETKTASVKAAIETRGLKKTIEVRLDPSTREFYLNGRRTPRPEIRQNFASVTFTPDTLAIIKQGPQERRAVFDSVAISFDGARSRLFQEFQRCLKARNRVLKDRLNATEFDPKMELVLDSLTETFLPLAASVTSARIQTIQMLIPTLQSVLRTIFNDASVDMSVDYVISEKSAIAWSQNQVYDALKTRLRDLRGAELSSGQSLVGPHKHDVRFYFNGQDARYFCSQGQQRAIALALKISQIVQHNELRNEFPVLLLDDVFSELDAEKQECLLSVLRETPAQIFLTTTEIEESRRFGLKDVKVFMIENGYAG